MSITMVDHSAYKFMHVVSQKSQIFNELSGQRILGNSFKYRLIYSCLASYFLKYYYSCRLYLSGLLEVLNELDLQFRLHSGLLV